ncbi:MAG TPA: CHAD domain-containing protein [Polyangiaceae bacterium]|jgi:CHAD domain-containing protein
MAAQIEPGLSLSQALRQAILLELSAARHCAQALGNVSDEALHEMRKHIKRARALLRLRPRTKAAERAQHELRSAAHWLGPAREEVAELECIRALAQSELAVDLAHPLRELADRLAGTRELVAGTGALTDALRGAAAHLARAHEQLAEWAPPEQGFSLIAPGLRATYARGRKAFSHALAERSSENLHALRRHAKSQFYQLNLLEPVWTGQIEAFRDELDELTTALGEHHDLSLLSPGIGQRICLPAAADDQLLSARLAQRLEEIVARVLPLARRVYAERPRAFVARHAEYFAAWSEEVG